MRIDPISASSYDMIKKGNVKRVTAHFSVLPHDDA